jgi:prevent-host-death family protein
MAKTVNVHAAKTQLSRLIDDAVNGEEIIIAKAGRPMVRLVSVRDEMEEMAERRRRSFGSLKGKISIPDDFNELPDDLARAFGIDPDEERAARRRFEEKRQGREIQAKRKPAR